METEFIQDGYADYLMEVDYYTRQLGYSLQDLQPIDYHDFRDAGWPAPDLADRLLAEHIIGLH